MGNVNFRFAARDRSALLLASVIVYLAWAHLAMSVPITAGVIAYDAHALEQKAVLNTCRL